MYWRGKKRTALIKNTSLVTNDADSWYFKMHCNKVCVSCIDKYSATQCKNGRNSLVDIAMLRVPYIRVDN